MHFCVCVCNPEREQPLNSLLPNSVLAPSLCEMCVSVSENYSVMLPIKVLSSLSITGEDCELLCRPSASLCCLLLTCSLGSCDPLMVSVSLSASGLSLFFPALAVIHSCFSLSYSPQVFSLLHFCTHLLTYSFCSVYQTTFLGQDS